MNKCINCNYIGQDAYWKGKYTTEEGNVILKDSMVFEYGDDTFNIDTPIQEIEDLNNVVIEDWDGETYCPKCRSKDYFIATGEEKVIDYTNKVLNQMRNNRTRIQEISFNELNFKAKEDITEQLSEIKDKMEYNGDVIQCSIEDTYLVLQIDFIY